MKQPGSPHTFASVNQNSGESRGIFTRAIPLEDMSHVDFFIAGSIHQGSERFKGQTMLRFYGFFSVTACSFTSSCAMALANKL